MSLAGFLSPFHPTEDSVSTMHQEPAMHDPASEPKPMPVLQAKSKLLIETCAENVLLIVDFCFSEMHSRWNEP
jgi:hypothetical protein